MFTFTHTSDDGIAQPLEVLYANSSVFFLVLSVTSYDNSLAAISYFIVYF